MNQLRQKLEQFMIGRYGIDELNRCLFVFYIVLFLLNILTQESLFYVLSICVIFYLFFRCLSKNHEARRRENARILPLIRKVQKRIHLWQRMWKDRHTHVYRKCPNCKSMLRLPKKKGTHTCSCPKCHHEFQIKG